VESNWREQHHVNIASCADDLIKYYYRELHETEEAIIDTKDVFEKFYSNVIAMSVLGVGRNCNYDRKSKVYEIAKDIENNLTSTSGSLKILVMNIFPWIKFRIFQDSIYEFLKDHVILEVKKRKRRKIDRKDFLQIFVNSEREWSDEIIAGQVMSFLTAGFSTTSALFQSCCYVLARNEKIKNQIKNSEFMDKFLYEVLRKWSPISTTSRVCSENFTLKTKSEEVFKFFKGDLIEFPLRLINNDHKNFNDPPAVNLQRSENLNLSFGLNPRACIGEKFAILIVKTLLTELMNNFEILPCDKTPYELNFCDKNSFSEKVFVKLKSKNKII
jgi:cytochrome P450 family 9